MSGCRAAAYNETVKLVLKSLAFAIFGAASFFAFFAMLAIPLLAAWSRLHNPNTPLESGNVLVQPVTFLRLVGLPLAAAAFVTCFVLGWKRFTHREHTL